MMNKGVPGTRGYRDLLVLCLGACVAMAVLGYFFSGKKTQFEVFLLGEKTKVVYAKVDGRPIHCGMPPACTESKSQSKKGKVAVWLGASHLHVITNYSDGDKTAPFILHNKAKTRNLDLITYSLGNANYQEFYIFLEALRSVLPIDKLIIGAVIDDMKEAGLRNGLTDRLSNPITARNLSKTDFGRTVLSQYVVNAQRADRKTNSDEKIQTTDPQTAMTNSNIVKGYQKLSEDVLSGWLMKNWRLWEARKEIRGQIILGLRELRHDFGVFRRVMMGQEVPRFVVDFPRAVYERNWAAFRSMLEVAKKNDIDTYVYIAPRRSDVNFPYRNEDYARFKKETEIAVRGSGGHYINLENSVPNELWTGFFHNERDETSPDIFHFGGKGHRVFSQQLAPFIFRNTVTGFK